MVQKYLFRSRATIKECPYIFSQYQYIFNIQNQPVGVSLVITLWYQNALPIQGQPQGIAPTNANKISIQNRRGNPCGYPLKPLCIPTYNVETKRYRLRSPVPYCTPIGDVSCRAKDTPTYMSSLRTLLRSCFLPACFFFDAKRRLTAPLVGLVGMRFLCVTLTLLINSTSRSSASALLSS